MSDSVRAHGLYGPWSSPELNTGVVSHSLLLEIFLTQGLNPGLLHCRGILYQLSYQGSSCSFLLSPVNGRADEPRPSRQQRPAGLYPLQEGWPWAPLTWSRSWGRRPSPSPGSAKFLAWCDPKKCLVVTLETGSGNPKCLVKQSKFCPC